MCDFVNDQLVKSNPSHPQARTSKYLPYEWAKINQGISKEDEHTLITETQECLPGGTLNWYPTGNPGTSFTLQLVREINTGGHHHGGGDTGSIYPSQGTIPPSGYLTVLYTAPLTSGQIKLISNFDSVGVDVDFIWVKVPGLIPLQPSKSLVLIGSTPAHPFNHFGHPVLIKGLNQLANKFYLDQKSQLYVNDISLEWGGLFDIKGNWSSPHVTHRDGLSVDVRAYNLTPVQRFSLLNEAKKIGFKILQEEDPPHLHLTLSVSNTMIRDFEKIQ